MNEQSSTWGWSFLLLGATIIMTMLKVAEVITWSWWIILLPLWMPFALSAVGIVLYFVLVIFITWLFRDMIARSLEASREKR